MTNKTSVEQIKFANRQAVLNLFRGNNLLSRTIVAKETGLSKATISRILSEMLAEGLVEEVRTSGAGVGRPRIMLRLVSRTRYAVGVELSSSVLRIILTDLNARPIRQRIPPVYNQKIDAIVESLSREVEDLCQDIPDEQLFGVGVAVPGIVNPSTGVVTMESQEGWQDIPLASQLSNLIGKHVILSNRTQAATWGEKWYGDSNQVADLLYVRLGSSVEAGMIIAGQLHLGKMYTSGAIGHMTLDPDGAYCACGNRGCLNTVAGSQALLKSARVRLKNNSASMLMGMVEGNPSFLNMDHLMSAIDAGDGLAVQIITEAGRSVGIIVASLLNLLSFQKVIIGGQLSMAGSALLTPIQEEVNRRALPTSLVACQIEITKLGADAAALGAASLLLQNLTT